MIKTIKYLLGYIKYFFTKTKFCYWNGETWICADPLEIMLKIMQRRVDFEAFGALAQQEQLSAEDLLKLIDISKEVFNCPKLSPSESLGLLNRFFSKLSGQKEITSR